MSTFDRVIKGPMANLEDSARILVGIDGVDLLSTVDRRRLFESFSDQPGACLLVAAREVGDVAARMNLPDRDPENVAVYLTSIVRDSPAAESINRACNGDWLLARILAGLWSAGRYDSDEIRSATNLSYVFDQAIAAALDSAPNSPVENVLAILATAPVGALMPLELLINACADYSGSARSVVTIRDALVALGELVARDAPGTPNEHTGPAHDLIAAFFAERHNANDLAAAHLSVALAIQQMREGNIPSAVDFYAKRHLSDHLLLAGRPEDAVDALVPYGTPADNLDMWESWLGRLADLGPDHPAVLVVRGNIAVWLGESGQPREALNSFTALLPDMTRVFGADHPNTLASRGNIALWTARSGDVRKALDEFAELLSTQNLVLGPEHPDSLATRGNIAAWTGNLGYFAEAVEKATELLPDLIRLLGPDHVSTFNDRSTIALWTGRLGNISQALAEYKSLLIDQERTLGANHQDVLGTRTNIAMLTAESGDLPDAIRQSRTLLHDQNLVLGADHPYTLATRGNLIKWSAQSEGPEKALRQLGVLLRDYDRVVGPDHPDTLVVRGDAARYTADSGYLHEALEQWTRLLLDRERSLGVDHRDTLATRNNIAVATWRSGNKKAAIALATALLRDQERALGSNHSDTEMTRRNLAEWSIS